MQPPGIADDPGELRLWERLPAEQQPDWREHPDYHEVCRDLASAPPLVTRAEIERLRRSLASVVTSDTLVLQGGDCAESFYECTETHTSDKLRLIHQLGERLSDLTGSNVIRVGRMGGQFAKPRSRPTERHGEHILPAFRGHMVNSELAAVPARAANPRRMLWAYDASDHVQRAMRGERHRHGGISALEGPWSSHEALVIDYEARLLRRDPQTGSLYLTSTHLPWVGERTRHPSGAHVALLGSVANPIGCKIGPAATPEEILAVCQVLDPEREPGRLTLIPRMGHDRIREVLPPIVRVVADAGHPVIWLSDPMHANTVVCSRVGLKTRHLADVVTEALMFRDVLEEQGQRAAGLHIEVAADDVTECLGGSVQDEDDLLRHYSSLCDPRLNIDQATELIEAWAKGSAARRSFTRQSWI
jgi:3-deoxy-7-phosphoheptulonate synthase